MKNLRFSLACVLLVLAVPLLAQQREYYPGLMSFDVGNINMSMNKVNGEGGLQSQFSWMLTGTNPQKTEIFYWPMDQYQSNLLYQIFNPLVLGDSGIIDENGVRSFMYSRGGALTNNGAADWAAEIRRYRPPSIVVDGLSQTAPYQWYVDPTLKSDIKIEFEDVCAQFGIRSHVEMYGFSNPYHADYFIWKATHKFTGEIKLPRDAGSPKDTLPDQTIQFWWPIAFSFGPSKAGERAVYGGFAYEGEDDLDSWFKRRTELVTAGPRDSLYVAYYWDAADPTIAQYPNGSRDDTGDPDRTTGHLYSTQIPGYALLHADKSASDRSDDIQQPYSLPHATIEGDLWGRRDIGLKLTYRGDDSRGRFPLDAITAGFSTSPQKGPMRFVCVGPYQLTKNAALGRVDSVTFVYAVAVGGMTWQRADSIGKLWFSGQISDSVKKSWVLSGRDSLWKAIDRANWAWQEMSQGRGVPSPPPPPDIAVTSGPGIITVQWSYPDPSYFLDPVTGVDDWYAWRVYRKRGASLVDDPLDQKSGARWELISEIRNRAAATYIDRDVTRGVDYYYAVTAVDDGTQNTSPIATREKLESSRFVTRSLLPAVPYKPGLNVSNQIRVVPNPATVAAGKALTAGTPDKISFFNLPYKCTLRVFTETGDLVKTALHLGTADHEWNQRTDDNQYVSSGIYVLAVTDCQDVDGNTLENQFVKFIIVR